MGTEEGSDVSESGRKSYHLPGLPHWSGTAWSHSEMKAEV